MSTEPARQARNASLVAAEAARARATRVADLEYSATVARLRAQFEADLAAANARRLAAVRPHHRAYNAAVAAAERLTTVVITEESVTAHVEYDVRVVSLERVAS
jgi:hypothetical protein